MRPTATCSVWMVSCIIMVFSALSEYGVLLYIMTYKLKNRNNNLCNLNGSNIHIISGSHDIISKMNTAIRKKDFLADQNDGTNLPEHTTDTLNNKMKKIDSVSLILFPFVFLSFVVCYLVAFLK